MNQQTIAAAIANVMPLARATGLFVSLFTAQAPDGLFGPTGAPSGSYADVVGLVDIACMDASMSASEARALPEIIATELHHVLLDGYFLSLEAGWRGSGMPLGAWRAVVDGVAYIIEGVNFDTQNTQTVVTVKLATE
jgi:hypothetical protein